MTVEPLPPRGAMHRDTPKGSRLEIANAYAVGRLVDWEEPMSDKPYPNWVCPHEKQVQAIADAWNEYVEAEKENINATVEWLNVVKLLDALGGTDNEQ